MLIKIKEIFANHVHFVADNTQCPAYGKQCNLCKNLNHFASQCRSTKKVNALETACNEEQQVMEGECNALGNLKCSLITVNINNKPFSMQLDTGASLSIIPRNFWNKLGRPRLTQIQKKIRMFDGSELKTLGEMESVVECDGRVHATKLVVTDASKDHGLIGTDIINMEDSHVTLHHMKYENLGQVSSHQASIKLKESSFPCYFESRALPIHLKQNVLDELIEMEKVV